MKEKNCLIFGGSGQIGSSLIRKLTQNNIRVTVVTRNIHQKGLRIKTQANAGYIDIVEANIFDEKKITNLFNRANICINLIGILYQSKKGNSFKNIHTIFPTLLAKLCKKYDLDNFIHISALGINSALDSNYAISKLEGEKNILNYFTHIIYFAILLSLIISFIGLNFSEKIFQLMVTTPEVTKLGLEYTDIIFAGSILFILVVALNSLLHAEGDTKTYRNVLILSCLQKEYC